MRRCTFRPPSLDPHVNHHLAFIIELLVLVQDAVHPLSGNFQTMSQSLIVGVCNRGIINLLVMVEYFHHIGKVELNYGFGGELGNSWGQGWGGGMKLGQIA